MTLLSLGESVVKECNANAGDNNAEIQWFHSLISAFISDYTLYLEDLGMESARTDLLVREPGKGGGAFYISPERWIKAPSVKIT